MAADTDLYAILGVAKGATADDIRKAYRKLARKYHPDVNQGDKAAEERFKQVSVAYDVLSDTDKRGRYDEFGMEGLAPGFDPQRAREYRRWADSGQGFQFRGGRGQPFDGADFGFGTAGPRGRTSSPGGFADILNEMFGGTMPRDQPATGRDLEHPLEIDFLDAVKGLQTTVAIRRPVACTTCGGRGRQGRRACTACTGSGATERRERLSVKIPPGVQDGARVRVAGKGAGGQAGGPAGDLYFVVAVRPHPLLRREGSDLVLDVPVTVKEAMLGATVTVPTLQGAVQLKVPAGSQSGQRLRLRGRGIATSKDGRAGDLIVRLMVRVPAQAGADVAAALETLEAAYGGDPRAGLTL